MIMTSKKEKKAKDQLRDALNQLADLDYVGFLILGKYGEKEFYYDANVESYQGMAKLIAVILTHCASRFDTTPEEFLKAVEKKFRLELSE